MLEDIELLGLSDAELLSVLALKRLPYSWEVWHIGGNKSARLALRSMHDFHAATPPLVFLIDRDQDRTIDFSFEIIERFYRVALDRAPTQSEIDSWATQSTVSLTHLAVTLLRDEETVAADGLLHEVPPLDAEMARQNHVSNYMQRDNYAKYLSLAIAENKKGLLSSTGRTISIALSLQISKSDVLLTQQILGEMLPVAKFEIEYLDPTDIDAAHLSKCDIFIANQYAMYDNFDEKSRSVGQARCLSACWHWDNHHMFELSAALCKTFDYIFPAHSNGNLSLYLGKAMVSQVVPCCVFQWSFEDSVEFFARTAGRPRSNRLYGRFNSYTGRGALRDQFLSKVENDLENNDVRVIYHSENKWNSLSSEDRFRELAGYKIVICNPIYHDIPARVFDAILAGAIPLIPFGLSDIEIAFTYRQQLDLPIIRYRPGDLASLAVACSKGRQAFDDAGSAGISRRHQAALNAHMIPHRVARIVSEIYNCQQVGA